MTSQFTWWLVMECGCGLSFSTSALLSSRWCFLVGSSGSLPQHCVLLRAETMADLAQEMDIILVKWLIGLLWCRFLETSFYIILLTPPCPSPSGWVWECVGTRTCVCAYVWALICVENKIKQVWEGEMLGRKTERWSQCKHLRQVWTQNYLLSCPKHRNVTCYFSWKNTIEN